jgi:transposase InsO family protein
MPWKIAEKERSRWEFMQAVLVRETSFAAVCRAHDISRECGHKWWRRFQRDGRAGLRERSRRPAGVARLEARWRQRCETLRRRHPTWGALKLRCLLRRARPGERLPGTSTITRWLGAAQLVRRRVRRAPAGPSVPAAPTRVARQANDVWTIDLKGQFRTGDGGRIGPLTVRDAASRYVLAVQPLRQPSDRAVRRVLTRLFRRWGLPRVMHMDNGAPFGGRGALGLSTLSVWWLRLGLEVEFSRLACPQDNGAHEQMHRVLKAETARPPAATVRAQLQRFRVWRKLYNEGRPHAALGQRLPASRYRRSPRRWPPVLPDWRYPKHWLRVQPGPNGRAWWAGRQRFLGRAFAHEQLGVAPLARGHSKVYLGPHLIGTLHPNDRTGLRPAQRT